jgi:hypothetical protein
MFGVKVAAAFNAPPKNYYNISTPSLELVGQMNIMDFIT